MLPSSPFSHTTSLQPFAPPCPFFPSFLISVLQSRLLRPSSIPVFFLQSSFPFLLFPFLPNTLLPRSIFISIYSFIIPHSLPFPSSGRLTTPSLDPCFISLYSLSSLFPPFPSSSPPPNILANDNRVSCADFKATPSLSSAAEKLLSVIYYRRTICLV